MIPSITALAYTLVITIVFGAFYLRFNDAKLESVPPSVLDASPNRWSDEEILAAYERQKATPVNTTSRLPPQTGRRYIVVGGAGFLGAWIVLHLLRRGEDPKKIRVLDLKKPSRPELTSGKALDVDFRICDVSSEQQVREHFDAPWPSTAKEDEPELTVFHTAASLRFFERLWSLVSLSAAANVRGVQHVLSSTQRVGGTVLVHTSSGSLCVQSSRWWLWPWEPSPRYFGQFISDDDAHEHRPSKHSDFFSNYAYTKWLGETIVRNADKSPAGKDGKKMLRTGSIRPGNSVYGPGGDISLGATLVRSINPTFIGHVVQNFAHVENVSLAHLCYEARLIPNSSWRPQNASLNHADVGGQAFVVCDAGRPPTFGDIYHALTLLTHGRTTFPHLSPSFLLFVAHIIESLHVAHSLLALSSFPSLASLVPRPSREALNLQPSLWSLVMVHLVFDQSRAMKELGYEPMFSTLEGVCDLVDSHEKTGFVDKRQKGGGGISIPKPILKLIGRPESYHRNGKTRVVKEVVEGAGLGAPHLVGESGSATPKKDAVGLDLDLQAVVGAKSKAE